MSSISIVGGAYRERCLAPEWDQVFGSGGRAAAALSAHIDRIDLHCYATSSAAGRVAALAEQYGFSVHLNAADFAITFDYIHPLSTPMITPAPVKLRQQEPIQVFDEVVLRFGMLEGSGSARASRCVYDPQSAFSPEPFLANGSEAEHLAVVGNQSEICRLGASRDPVESANRILGHGAEVVVIKRGLDGAIVIDGQGSRPLPAFRAERSWTIGSGDVFAAVFAASWGVHEQSPFESAKLASRCVAAYSDTMALPVPAADSTRLREYRECQKGGGTIYLAGPFFSLPQRWMIEESYRYLQELGLKVFSPLHDVGHGAAHSVVPADIEGIDMSDAMFAILDGLDTGTVFEVGYARAKGKPVYALAQAVSGEDLKMIIGSECKVFDDFSTALYHAAIGA